MSRLIKKATKGIIRSKLVFRLGDVGTNYNQSFCAMAMCLTNVPIYEIILMKNWFPNTFLIYFQRKVQETNKRIFNKMMIMGKYFTIHGEAVCSKEPHTMGKRHNFSSSTKNHHHWMTLHGPNVPPTPVSQSGQNCTGGLASYGGVWVMGCKTRPSNYLSTSAALSIIIDL